MPNSLHYLDRSGRTMNQYQQAILAIGGILKEYSSGQWLGSGLDVGAAGAGGASSCEVVP
jgi:hypothetical protein